MDDRFDIAADEANSAKFQMLSNTSLYLSTRLDAADRKASLMIPASGLVIGLMHSDLFANLINDPRLKTSYLILFPLAAMAFLVIAMTFSVVAQWPRNENGKDLLSRFFNKSTSKEISEKLISMTTSDLIMDWVESHKILVSIFSFKVRMFRYSAIFFFLGCLLDFLFYAYHSGVWEALLVFTKAFPTTGG